MRRIISYFMIAPILSISSIALVAALFATDVFAKHDPVIGIATVLLSVLYFALLLLADYSGQKEKKNFRQLKSI